MAATSALMKLDLCGFSGYKIYPGKGKRYARVDGKVFNFLNQKSEHSFLMRRNPRKICWTVLYRRKHKKGTMEEVAKKRTKRTQKFQRAIQGATLESIMAKRNQKPEVRKAQREQLIRQAKEKNKSNQQKKAATKPAQAARTQTGKKAAKVVKTAAPRVGGKR
ncbi:large ribosomal subunit protein eL24-like [Sycon ciliatum]|uniref:large ribosomal subunit protein eL24-like n=1 Tax=Sycon ciliatum TaxID=27933 RepID=UPI0020AD60FA|eukprot:scpid105882/ scgid14612/ 60S ribosomal protein L24